MKKPLLITGSLIAATALALTGCSSGSQETESANSLESIIDSGTIRVGLEGEFVPYNYHDENGELIGFETEIAEVIAEDLGVAPEFVETSWESLIAGLDTDKYDFVINNIAATEERQEKYDFTIPYAYSQPQILVHEDSDIQSVADLDGASCGQTASSNYADRARESGAEIVPTNGFSESVELVLGGRADCTINDVVTMAAYQNEHPDSPVRTVDAPEMPGINIHVMIAQEQPELLEKLNEIIEARLADGTFEQIFIEYIGQDISPKEQ